MIGQVGWGNRNKPKPQGSIRSVYDAAATQQAEDYDSLNNDYRAFGQSARENPNRGMINYEGINPTFNTQNISAPAYSRGRDLDKLIHDFQGYADTGGYSGEDISNIRERGISPIRSVYANAQRDLNRQKVLSGGYSPNAGAVTAKMAREQGDLLSGATTKVNADIAQMVAQGKLSGLSGLSPLLDRENALRTETEQRNAALANDVAGRNADEQRRVDEINNANKLRVAEFNARQGEDNRDREFQSLQGRTNLYGTTPALTQTFGNQVLQNNAQKLQASTTANQLKNQRTNMGMQMVANQIRPNGWRA